MEERTLQGIGWIGHQEAQKEELRYSMNTIPASIVFPIRPIRVIRGKTSSRLFL